jgi:EAL domain-containing protein (putative c-di-GMP-specific phosphodiesterase class I)
MGKSLQPLNATAVRQPVNTPSAAPAAIATPAPNEPATAESLGWQLRAALPPLRLHSVSLCDEEANVLWLSEGALGPDEHNLVVEAIDALGNDTSLNCYENGLEDGRVAIFLPVRSPQGNLVGLAMILADIKSVNDNVIERMVTPQVRTIMQKVAVLLRTAPGRAPQGDAPLQILELAPVTSDVTVAPIAPAALAPAVTAATMASALSLAPSVPRNASAAAAGAKPAASPAPVIATAAAKPVPVLSPQAVDDILEFELTPEPRVPTQRLPTLAPTNTSDLSLELTSDTSATKKAAPQAPAAPVISGIELPAAVAAKPANSVFAANIATFPTPVSAAPQLAADDEFAPPVPMTLPLAPAVSPPTLGAAPAAIKSSAASIKVNGAQPTVGLNGSHAPELNGSHVPGAMNGAALASGSAQAATNGSLQTVNGSAAAANGSTTPLNESSVPVSLSATTTSKALSTSVTGTSRTLGGSTGNAKVLAAGATTTSRVLQLPDGINLILEVQPFSKLRAGGRTRRYEVLARSSHPGRVPAGLDSIALQRLLAWMGTNRAAWSLEPTSFTLNLSITTLEDERFPQFVASNLKAHGIAADNIGFEIAEPLCLQRRAQVERFITLCDKLGCFVVIDDFSLDSSIVSLLRSKALRLVKIDPKLTSVALKDKLAQAMVVAIAQAVKVLGIHCAAKRVESQAALQWLTAIGCDFAQGTALAQVQPLETLGIQPAPTPGAA